MDTAIAAIICIVLMVFGGMTMSQGFLDSVDTTTSALEDLGERGEDIMRTELTVESVTMAGNGQMVLDLENSGQTKLADFENWDVMVHYYSALGDYYTNWLPYNASGAGNNEWEKTGIYLDGAAETFEPGVLNPGETLKITAKIAPNAGNGTDKMMVVATPNGIPASVSFR